MQFVAKKNYKLPESFIQIHRDGKLHQMSCHVVAKRRQPHNIPYVETKRKTTELQTVLATSEMAWVV